MMSLNLAQYLASTARDHPNQLAVIYDSYRLTYAEIQQFVNRVANVLVDRDIRKGDKVAMMIPNTPHFPILYYAILSIGATVVPVNNMLRAHEIQALLEDSDAKAFFVWRQFYDEARHAFEETETCYHLLVVSTPEDSEQPPIGELVMPAVMEASQQFDYVDTMPDDTAVILYTSGTTGHPKGAELTHFNMFFNALYVRDRIVCLTEKDVLVGVLPLFHSFGQTCVMNATFLAGATITLLPKFEMPKVMEVIERDRATVFCAVPSMYYFMLHTPTERPYDLSSLRLAISGGSALPVELLKQFQERYGIRILEGYGLTETSPVASFNVLERPSKPGSIGVPIWGCEMRVMCEDGRFAKTGEVGEIVIRGHNVMKGYYKKPVATQEAIVDGWFHTGDMARVDEDGYFFIVDRKKDIIIRSGMNIYPREIEEILYGHPAVLEVSVVGVPDEARGEEVKAFIALKPGASATPEQLRQYCSERMARYKVPKYFEIVSSLPKGSTGKILKRELRKLHSSQNKS